MIRIDLITGFLGSGKTTFLKKYVRFLLSAGERIGIIENDYGAVNIDRMLLAELAELGCEIETITGGCDADCHKRRFKTKLIALGMSGVTRVIVEPSGIFDTEEFFDVINEAPLDRIYEPGSVIAVADSLSPPESSPISTHLLASQLVSAGAVVLSRTQFPECSIEEKLRYLNSICSEINGKINGLIITKSWDDLSDSDYAAIRDSGYFPESFPRIDTYECGYKSLYLMNLNLSSDELRSAVSDLFSSEGFGNIHRVKGFFQENDQWYALNAANGKLEINRIAQGQNIIIIIGENLNEKKIKSEFKNGEL